MREKIVVAGIPNADPSVLADPTSQPVPMTTTLNGVLYVALTDGAGTIGQFISNAGTSPVDSLPINLRTVAFGYHFDPLTNDWVQAITRDNSLAEIDPDTVFHYSVPVINYQYIWDQSWQVFRRMTAVPNNGQQQVSDLGTNLQVVSYPYMSSVDIGSNPIWTRQRAMSVDSVGEICQALLTVEQLDAPSHDAPAANTAATVSASAGNGAPVKISGIGYSITAVAALAAPVLIELREDATGTNNLIWSTLELVPVGQSKTVMLPVNMLAQVDCTLTVADPGAANFVTATLITNTSMGDGSP